MRKRRREMGRKGEGVGVEEGKTGEKEREIDEGKKWREIPSLENADIH